MALEKIKPGDCPIIEQGLEIGKKINWRFCRVCGEEWSKLEDDGSCPDCRERRDKKQIEQLEIPRYTFEEFDENLQTAPMLNAVREFLKPDNKTGGLYVFGDPGLGKSHLAIAATNTLRNSFKHVCYENVPKMLLSIKLSFGNSDDMTERDVYDRCTVAEYLILDELKDKTDFCMSVLWMILDAREKKGKKKTLITSNFSLAEIAQVDLRVADRIGGFCGGVKGIIEIRGESWRVRTL